MPILLFVKCEMAILFPVKRDQYPPFTNLYDDLRNFLLDSFRQIWH